MTNYKHLEQLLTLLNSREHDLLSAVLTAFAPPRPHVAAAELTKKSSNNLSAGEVWEKYVDAEFKCVKCGSGLKIGLSPVDGDPSNSAPENLEVLCQACNRDKQANEPKIRNLNAKVFLVCLLTFQRTGSVPPASAVANYLKVQSLGGASTVYKWVKYLLEKSVEGVDNSTQED